jgi:molybdopterin-binding protein
MLKIRNLKKRLADFIVEDISFDVKNGEYLVILGPTGTGKTVLLELISGFIKPDQGRIYFGEQEITDYSPEDRKVGMVYQDYMLFPHLDVRKNIGFGLKVKGLPSKKIKKKVAEIVELFSIEHLLNRDVTTLSGGEKQRVALARALITSPEILILDEPLSALDPATKESFQDELKKIHKQLKTTTLHVTHDFVEAIAMADRIAVMNNGQIVQIGTADEIFQKPASSFVANFIGSKNIFSAELTAEDDDYVQIEAENGPIKIAVVGSPEGKINLAVRPEDIILSKEAFFSTARNCFKGKIKDIKDKLTYLEIIVDIGVEISVHITRQSYREFELTRGKEVYLTFKASTVHIY